MMQPWQRSYDRSRDIAPEGCSCPKSHEIFRAKKSTHRHQGFDVITYQTDEACPIHGDREAMTDQP